MPDKSDSNTGGLCDGQDSLFEEIKPEEVIMADASCSRWRTRYIGNERAAAAHICNQAIKDFGPARHLHWIFGLFYRLFGRLHADEMNDWSRATGIPFGKIAMVNCSYELSHIVDSRPVVNWKLLVMFGRSLFARRIRLGCTAGIARTKDGKLIHVRTLDWPNKAMGDATRVIECSNGAKKWTIVTLPGMVGVLSGMRHGEYSVTIDWAPPTGFPSFDFGPTFLLRATLETCGTYEDAVKRLKTTLMSTSVFFTVCGKDKSCIIERTPDDCGIRDFKGKPLTQANHYASDKFGKYEHLIEDLRMLDPMKKEDPLLWSSEERAQRLFESLENLHGSADASNLKLWLSALDVHPVTNEQTVQRMVFCPEAGQLLVDRRIG